ncbi:MAG: sulfatase-like hydrolase/transferase [Bacteroidetes bacterium]|nr:sulfatase-like hydrolase/transferase [Bacteroidota bacterium]
MDQMHWEAMSAYGNANVKTPGMDKIAEDGYSFRASYASMPQCCPARACWYTGLTSVETGMPTNKNKLRQDIPDLGQWLTKHGNYKSAYSGKWHVNGRDVTKSFDLLYGKPMGKGEYIDGSVARACMGFLENYSGDEPFFLNAGFLNPHDCCYSCGAAGGQGKLGFAGEIEDQLPPLPENWVKPEKPWGFTGDWTELDWRYYIYTYYRWVEMVDAEIASLYDALINSRFADNTVVIFTSDHGDGLGFHGKVSKGFMEEESWRVPTIIVDPGKALKGVHDVEHLSIGVDMAATICDYAEVPMLPDMTVGKSLRPIAEGEKVDDWREYIVGESFLGTGRVAVRDKQYKTILYCDGKPTQIYDLKNDPLEMNNLSSRPEGKEVFARHEEFLSEYLNKIEVFEPENKDREHEVYLNYYNNIKKGIGPATVDQTAQGKTRKMIDRSLVNSYVEPNAIEPVTGYLSTFSPLSGKNMQGDFTAHYELVAWMGAAEKSKNAPMGSLDVSFDNGQCRTIETRDGRGTVAAPGSTVKTSMKLSGENNTTTQWTLESQVEDRDHVNFIEEGLWAGKTINVKTKSWNRQMTTSNPLIHRWALLPLLASGSIKEAPLVFDMLDDSALRPNQTLSYKGRIDVPVEGGEVKMDSYVQIGESIVPIHYLVDDKGQVQLITMGTVNWALTAK